MSKYKNIDLIIDSMNKELFEINKTIKGLIDVQVSLWNHIVNIYKILGIDKSPEKLDKELN